MTAGCSDQRVTTDVTAETKRPQRERWRLIPGYGDCYFISDKGRVLSLNRHDPHVMLQTSDKRGYSMVQLSHANRTYNRFVHQLVAEAFHGPCPEGLECRHLNGNKMDNRALNLKWGTQSENSFDRVRHGTHHEAAKTHCSNGHPFDADNTYRRPSRPNSRDCRACHRERYERKSMRAASITARAA